MADGLLSQGLELFSTGDVSGAAKIWLRLQKREPDNRQAEAYLRHIQALHPDLYEQIFADNNDDTSNKDNDAPIRPVSIPVPIPVPPIPISVDAEHLETDPWGHPDATVVVDAGGLELVVDPIPTAQKTMSNEMDALEKKLNKLFKLDDFSGALKQADVILAAVPHHPVAEKLRKVCIASLLQMCRSRIGDLQSVPKVLISQEDLIWLDLDHRSGFVLAQIDGFSTFEDIAELTGMPELESYQIMAKLVCDGIIGPTIP